MIRKIGYCILAILVVLVGIRISSADSPPYMEWIKTLGEEYYPTYVQHTEDGGYITIGSISRWIGSDGQPSSEKSLWISKTDTNGNMLWDRMIDDRYIQDVTAQATSDKGYIIASSFSINPSSSDYNIWLIKIDKDSIEEWNRTFEHRSLGSRFIKQTLDGGYIIISSGASYGRDIIKTDINGNQQWLIQYRPEEPNNYAYTINDVQPIADGYILVGARYCTIGSCGNTDYWIGKIDSNGNKLWEKTINPSNDYESLDSIQQTSDSGYIITGNKFPDGGPTSYILIKTDDNFNWIWNKTFGQSDQLVYAKQTSDNGYIITKTKYSRRSDVSLMKIDENGNDVWSKTFGGLYSDEGVSAFGQTNNGYIIAIIESSKICGNFARLMKISNSTMADATYSYACLPISTTTSLEPRIKTLEDKTNSLEDKFGQLNNTVSDHTTLINKLLEWIKKKFRVDLRSCSMEQIIAGNCR